MKAMQVMLEMQGMLCLDAVGCCLRFPCCQATCAEVSMYESLPTPEATDQVQVCSFGVVPLPAPPPQILPFLQHGRHSYARSVPSQGSAASPKACGQRPGWEDPKRVFTKRA